MPSRRSLRVLAVLAALGLASALAAQDRAEIAIPPNGGNQKAEVTQYIGLVKVTVSYHSPRVHNPPTVDRTGHIWGELVHYGFFDDGFGPSTATPWRAGANETTTISFSHDVQVGGQTVRAGTYGLFVVVEPTGPWTWILSSNASGWGAYQYDPRQDVVRVQAPPTDAPFTEFLTYSFDERRRNTATLTLAWELKRLALRIDVPNVLDLYVQQLRKDLQSWAGFDARNWEAAATFCANNRVNLEEALTWADLAINGPFRGAAVGDPSFGARVVKANVLTALGRVAQADSLMTQALDLPTADAPTVYLYGSRLLAQARAARALEIFRASEKRHPRDTFWVALGLAQGLAATGDTTRAIAQWEVALRTLPDDQRSQRAGYEASLAALRKGRAAKGTGGGSSP
ncbi:MAG: DUF2911 domain-containing protein [Gemmatimonadetes bacterium]|nr:DUF2911 domain-containing protein [Gemmatimonadota bacterium]